MISYVRGWQVKRQRTIGKPVFTAVVIGFMVVFSGWAVTASDRIVSLDASVDRSKVGIDDVVTLTVTAHTEDVKSLPKPKLPALDGFDVVGESTGSSLSVSIVNGKRTQKREQRYIYTLKPWRILLSGQIPLNSNSLKTTQN